MPPFSALLRDRTAELEQLRRDLVILEAAPTPRRPAKVDPDKAVEVMREVIGQADAKKKRAFLGAFIEKVVVGGRGCDRPLPP